MSEKKGKKRPKSYYLKCAAGGKKFHRANDLAAGMKGFLVTCNKYERETVREMYNLLNEYADQLFGPEVKAKDLEDSDKESDEEDMEKAMAKETSAMKEAESKERRFQNTDTKSKNCIFVRTTVEDPCELAHKIFTDIVEKQVQKVRYALRMLPISVTCKANMDNIKEAAGKILRPHFETDFGVGLKYTSVCKIRNNQSVSRTAILPSLGRIIQELNPLHKLCYNEPDLVIIVEVIRNICCISVVKDYFNFKKYNFHEVLVNKAATGSESTGPESNSVQEQEKTSESDTLEIEIDTVAINSDAKSDKVEVVEVKEKSKDKRVEGKENSEGGEVEAEEKGDMSECAEVTAVEDTESSGGKEQASSLEDVSKTCSEISPEEK